MLTNYYAEKCILTSVNEQELFVKFFGGKKKKKITLWNIIKLQNYKHSTFSWIAHEL